MTTLKIALAIGILARNAAAVNNGLARTPQMGWVGTLIQLSTGCVVADPSPSTEQLELPGLRRF
jgi:hypothetical protein